VRHRPRVVGGVWTVAGGVPVGPPPGAPISTVTRGAVWTMAHGSRRPGPGWRGVSHLNRGPGSGRCGPGPRAVDFDHGREATWTVGVRQRGPWPGSEVFVWSSWRALGRQSDHRARFAWVMAHDQRIPAESGWVSAHCQLVQGRLLGERPRRPVDRRVGGAIPRHGASNQATPQQGSSVRRRR
jgi:hypothetical protein